MIGVIASVLLAGWGPAIVTPPPSPRPPLDLAAFSTPLDLAAWGAAPARAIEAPPPAPTGSPRPCCGTPRR